MGKEALEFAIELCRQCLVVTQHQRRLVDLRDHVGHSKRFSRSGHTQKGLIRNLLLKALHQCLDGLGLITRGFIC